MNRIVFSFLFLALILTSFSHNNKTIENIKNAHQSGQINYEEALLQKFYAVFDQTKLNQEFSAAGLSAVKCATHLVAEYRNNADRLSSSTREKIESYIIKKGNSKENSTSLATYISPYQKFELTYSTSGSNGVPGQDLDNSGVPDYVERVAEYFDHSWRVLIDTLGFKEIPLQNGEYYQISFENMDAYGYTTWNGSTPGTEIVMHNTYQGFPNNTDPDGRVLGAAKVTAVHEFKHAIQFVYNNWGEPGWFIEADATWSEDIGFDRTNDYYNYLGSSQIVQPGRGLANGDGYEDNLYFHFFTEKYGDDTNREIWERREQYGESVYSSVDNMLSNYGAFFDEAFAEYFVWLYNTGARYNPNLPGFGEAAQYPTPGACTIVNSLPTTGMGCNREALSANFLVFESNGQNQYLELEFAAQGGNNVLALITTFTDNSANVVFNSLNNNSTLNMFLETKLENIDKVVAVMAATSTSASNFDYDFTFDVLQTAEFFHNPFTDTEQSGDIEFLVTIESPQNLAIIDSLRVYYQIDGAGYQAMPLSTTGNPDEYSATLPNPGDEIQIDYYFSIADSLEQKVYFPASAPDSVFSFYVGADVELPVVLHELLDDTPKFNFPLYIYAEISDNVGLDSAYLESRVNDGAWLKSDLSLLGADVFVGKISPAEIEETDKVDYRITAVDNSSNNNKIIYPETGFQTLTVSKGYYFGSSESFVINEHFLLSTDDTISVSEDVKIKDINIYLESNHPKFSELYFRLRSPSGDDYTLYNQDWLESENESAAGAELIIDNEAFFTFPDAILENTDSAKGVFAPVDRMLNELYGSSALGNWVLKAYDKELNEEIGEITHWALIVEPDEATDVEIEEEEVIFDYTLSQNYPNPFNPATRIEYQVASSEMVSLTIYDVLGREVKTLVNEQKAPGTYSVTFDASNLSSGIYFYTLRGGSFSQTRKMILLR